jgi:hypothetical protein
MSSALRLPRTRILALDPATVEGYLVARGWEVDPQASTSETRVYHLPAEPEAEILVPRDKDYVDYALRVGEVLQALAVAERRTAWELLEDDARQQTDASGSGLAPSKRGRRNGTAVRRGKRDTA